jgi:hypothetical protein
MTDLARRAVLSAGLVLLAAPACLAESLRLENGRVMHGTVDRAYVDDHHLRIQLFSTGGVVKVRWEHIIPEDRDRWQVDLGLKESAEAQELKIDGHEVLFVNGDKKQGLVLNPEALDQGASAEVRIQMKGQPYAFPRGTIAKVTDARLDLALVYTPRQAYEIKRDQINPNNGQAHFDLAEYARAVGAYEEAYEHYGKAKEDVEFLKTRDGKLLDSKLATLEILRKNKALQQDLEAIRLRIIAGKNPAAAFPAAARAFLEARVEMQRLVKEVPDPKVQKEFRMSEIGLKIETERRAFFQNRLPQFVYAWLWKKADEKSKEKKVVDFDPTWTRQQRAAAEMQGTFEGAKQYFTRAILDDLWTYLVESVGAGDMLKEIQAVMDKDPAKLTEEQKQRAVDLARMDKELRGQLLDYWTNREKRGGYATSYGTGSFIVVKSDLKLVRKPPTSNKSGKGGNQSQAVDVIKTNDQWWEEVGSSDRARWLLSWFAEKGTFLEASRIWDDPCDACGGLGYKKVSQATTGEEEVERCRSCNGCKVIHKVRWR